MRSVGLCVFACVLGVGSAIVAGVPPVSRGWWGCGGVGCGFSINQLVMIFLATNRFTALDSLKTLRAAKNCEHSATICQHSAATCVALFVSGWLCLGRFSVLCSAQAHVFCVCFGDP